MVEQLSCCNYQLIRDIIDGRVDVAEISGAFVFKETEEGASFWWSVASGTTLFTTDIHNLLAVKVARYLILKS